METTNPAQEWQRLTELYRTKADGELEAIAEVAYELTDMARNVLSAEISSRNLNITIKSEPPIVESVDEETHEGEVDVDPYDLDLRMAYTAWNHEELLTARRELENAGIASFIGDDNVQDLENINEEFDDHGIQIKVRYVDWNRALWVLKNTLNANEPEEDASIDESLPKCPKCRSEEIVFLSRDPADKNKFRWRCDNCGNKWVDDGVVR